MTERDYWNAFKKKAREHDPLGSKLDYRYYKRLRAIYKSSLDSTVKLNPWLKHSIPATSQGSNVPPLPPDAIDS